MKLQLTTPKLNFQIIYQKYFDFIKIVLPCVKFILCTHTEENAKELAESRY